MMLEPKPGFDWNHVSWSRPDSPQPVLCCYCSAHLPDDSVPLTMWSKDGHAASFCDECQRKWWGLK